jgi:signal transduction histidine kinase
MMNAEHNSETNPMKTLEELLNELQSMDLPEKASALAAESLELLAEAKQEKAGFVSTVSHELRIPMTSIMGYTDLLKGGMMGELNDNQLNFLGVIRENVGRMSKLIADLSDIYKIESGRLNLETLAMPLMQAVRDGVDQTSGLIESRGQQVTLSLPEDLGLVQADPTRTAQIVHYLLENAALYSPEGSPIEIKAAQNGAYVRLSVVDQGIGVASEDQAHMFTQFFRSEVEEVREHKGWGLSLCTVRSLAELGGGKVGYETEPGKGSTFWVTFPKAGG